MNRTFISQLTPSRARLLKRMRDKNPFYLDDTILSKCDEDLISEEQFQREGITDVEERDAIQFVIDMKFRVGLPYIPAKRDMCERIIAAAINIGGFADNCVSINDDSSSIKTYIEAETAALLPQRKKLLIVRTDGLESIVNCESIGKMFPRIIAHGSIMLQYSFLYGTPSSTTTNMGKLLYPAVEESMSRTTFKRNSVRAFLAMGVYPELMEAPFEIKN